MNTEIIRSSAGFAGRFRSLEIGLAWGLACLNLIYAGLVLVAQAADTSDLQLFSALPVAVGSVLFAGLVALLYRAKRDWKGLAALMFASAYAILALFTYLPQFIVIPGATHSADYQKFVGWDLQNQDSLVTVTDMFGYLCLGITLILLAFGLEKVSEARRVKILLITGGILGIVSFGGFLIGLPTARYLALAFLLPVLFFLALAFVRYLKKVA